MENIHEEFPEATIIDVTSKGEIPFVKFSPFYPIGDIPVPHSEGVFASSVEGIWQGLKVFENHDIDISKFHITTMKGLKRTVRKFGIPLGHRKGVSGVELLNYIAARREIYVPVYLWVLRTRLIPEVTQLRDLGKDKDIVLLDYETNDNIEDRSKPLSHASLIRDFLNKM